MNLMDKIAAGCKAGFSIILGSCLYFSLNWIPVLGPVSTGFIASKIAGVGIKKGFAIGVLSGVGGIFLVLIVLFHFNMLDISLLFILGLWNVFGILFAGAGGAFASVISAHNLRFSYADDFRKKQDNRGMKDTNNDVYIVCPRCGTSNFTNRKECAECGNPID